MSIKFRIVTLVTVTWFFIATVVSTPSLNPSSLTPVPARPALQAAATGAADGAGAAGVGPRDLHILPRRGEAGRSAGWAGLITQDLAGRAVKNGSTRFLLYLIHCK
jgi:hypothetical protein